MGWLGTVTASVLAVLITAWLSGIFKWYLPSPRRLLLAFSNVFCGKIRPLYDRFRFVLSWLENDPDGDDASIVAQAFRSVQYAALVRSARIVKASGAADEWRPAMQRSAGALLERWHADLAVVGTVKKPGEVLSLWFVPRADGGTLGRGDQPYKLEDVTLGEDFHDDLRAEIAAIALAAVAPLAYTETRGRVIDRGLMEASNKLASLLGGWTVDSPVRRASLHSALGNALQSLGDRESGTERLEQSLRAYRAALEDRSRERMPLEWAGTQNNLGNTLCALGEREHGTERLEQAVEAHRAALEERTRDRVPLEWAMTQNNLGGYFTP